MISASKSTPATSDSKTADFARLFDLFERLASRKARAKAQETTPTDDLPSLPIPPDLAPVVTKLAGLISPRKHQSQAQNAGAKGKRPQNRDSLDSDSDDEASLAKFPLAKRYPFTFRMMLHKLYQLDDWAQKVKDVLERSQIEYKPLAETAMVIEVDRKGDQEQGSVLGLDGQVTQDGRVHFKAGTAGGSRKPGATRPRSHSLAVTVSGKARDGASMRSPRLSPTKPSPPAEGELRAVKKRCVGRRKSVSGPLVTTETGLIGGTWVYDATISAAEPAERRETRDGTGFAAPSPALKVGSVGDGTRSVRGTRRVSLGAPGLRSQGVLDGPKSSTRRRALSIMNNVPAHTQARQMKRRLEF